MKKLIVLLLVPVLFVGCASTVSPTSSTGATTSTASISQSDLVLIQTGATIATGAVLQFVETTPSSRTSLANEIYSSANAVYSLSTGQIPSAAQLNATILSFAGTNPAANYTQYASALTALYQSFLGKIGTNGANAISVLGAIAQGAQSAAAAYTSTPTP